MNLFPLLVPPGNDTEVIYNDGGLFGADSTFTFNNSTKVLTTTGQIIDGTIALGLDMSGGTFATAVQNWTATPVIQANGSQIIKFDSSNFNVFLGSDVFQNDDGQYNIGIGYRAGFNNSTSGAGAAGDRNVYIGRYSGYGGSGSDNIGSYNLAIGFDTLFYNTTGDYNIALGAAASFRNTTGDFNTAIGFRSAYYNQVGQYNTDVGYYSSGFGAGGVYNHSFQTAVGAFSAYNIRTGNYNTFLGYESGKVFTTGSGNVMLGFRAGKTANGIVSAGSNSNLLVIANDDSANHAPLIEGYFAAHASGPKLFFNAEAIDVINHTHEDTDGGRETKLNFRGEKSGGEDGTLVIQEISHDGSADDFGGKWVLSTHTKAEAGADTLVDVIKVDAAQSTFIGDAGTTNYSKFEADGTYEMNGAATVFEDIIISLSAAKVPAANAPTWAGFVGNLKAYTYDLNDFQEFTTELSHAYKEGATIEFHVHGATNGLDGDNRTIKFEIEYSIADVPAESGFGDVFPATTTISAEVTIPASTTDLTSFSIDIGDDTSGSFEIGALVKGRIRRIASTGTEPAGDPFVTQVGIHLENNTIGSRTETTK